MMGEAKLGSAVWLRVLGAVLALCCGVAALVVAILVIRSVLA